MEMAWDWKSITSLLATLLFLRTAIRDFLPPELCHFLATLYRRLFTSAGTTSTLIVDEFHGGSAANELYEAVQSYLSARCLSAANVRHLFKSPYAKTLTSSLPSSHSATDVFQGVDMKWWSHAEPGPQRNGQRRYFELSFHRRHRQLIYDVYVPHILEEAEQLKLRSRERRLFTNRPFGCYAGDDEYPGFSGCWSAAPFHHPSTFDNLAIAPDLRDSIRNDLLRFSARRDYYSRLGRAWKRGYLLHGPPGTGKTSLIAAIANFLEYDVYDIELTAVGSNTQLRKLLVSTAPKSVVVIEDIDCSLDLSGRKKKISRKRSDSTVSLSGVLNFVDGLWSSCVGETLMIFTTNHPKRLDPALLRPGRMDRKIHLSYCQPPAFRVLVRNYLQLEEEHELITEAEGLLGEAKVTPADVAEIFMGCDGDEASVALGKVVEDLRNRKDAMLLPQNQDDGPDTEKVGCCATEKAEAGDDEKDLLTLG